MQTRIWTIFTRQGKSVTALALQDALAGLDAMVEAQADCMVLLAWCASCQADWLEVKLLRADAVPQELRAISLGEPPEGWYQRDAERAQAATLCQLIGPLARPQVVAMQQQIADLRALRSRLTELDQTLADHANAVLAEVGDTATSLPNR